MTRLVSCGIFVLLCLATMAMAGDAPAVAPFAERWGRVQAVLQQEQIAFDADALYDNQGRPLMRPNGRQAVNIYPVDLAPSEAQQ